MENHSIFVASLFFVDLCGSRCDFINFLEDMPPKRKAKKVHHETENKTDKAATAKRRRKTARKSPMKDDGYKQTLSQTMRNEGYVCFLGQFDHINKSQYYRIHISYYSYDSTNSIHLLKIGVEDRLKK